MYMRNSAKLIIFILILNTALNIAFAQTPRTATEWYKLGNQQLDSEKYQQAIESYTKSLELEPNYYKANINRGVAYHELGKYEQAISEYTHVLKFKPFEVIAFYNRGRAFQKAKKHKEAIRDFTYVIAFNLKDTDAYLGRSISYCEIGQKELAGKDEAQIIKYGGKVTHPCEIVEEKRIYAINDASWKKHDLRGTGLSIMSPKEFNLLQSKPSEVGQNQLAHVFYATDFNDIDVVVVYEKRLDKESVLEKMNFSKKLFDERYKDAESEVFTTNFEGKYKVHFFGKYTDPKTKKKMVVDQVMFGENGEYYSLRIAYPRFDMQISNIVFKMFGSFKTENYVAKAESNEPKANWKLLQLNGLHFQTPTSQTDPNCSKRYGNNRNSFAQKFYCYKWNKTLEFDVGYGNFIGGKTLTPNAAAVSKKASEVLFENTYNTGSTNDYSITNMNLGGGAEAVKLKIINNYGLASRVTEIIYIKRGLQVWEVRVAYAGEDQFDIAVKNKIINSLSIK